MSTLGAVVDLLSLVGVPNGRVPVLASFSDSTLSTTQLEALAVSPSLNPKLVLRCDDLAQTVFANVQTAIEPHRQVIVPAAAVAAISSNLAIAAGPLSTELETGVVDHLLTTTRAVHELVKAVDPLLGVARKDGNLRFVRELETPSGSAETPLTFCTRFDAIYTEGEAPPPQRNAWLAEIGNPKLILCEAQRRDAGLADDGVFLQLDELMEDQPSLNLRSLDDRAELRSLLLKVRPIPIRRSQAQIDRHSLLAGKRVTHRLVRRPAVVQRRPLYRRPHCHLHHSDRIRRPPFPVPASTPRSGL